MEKKRLVSTTCAALMLCGMAFALPVAAAEGDTDIAIKIVHTNDIHARVQENAKSGIIGVERLKTAIDNYTADADMDLVLDSGDLFHGQAIATLVDGESVADLVKVCGYDAMTAGNHDWSYGADRLKELCQIGDLQMLTGNVVKEDGSQFFDEPYYIEEVTKGGATLKVGIFGVIDPNIYRATAPANVAGLSFTDAAEYAKTAVADLQAQGCGVIIGLTHTYEPAALAAQVDGVNLWLAGHEHIDINEQVTTPNGGTATVIENAYYLGEIGLIELDCTVAADGTVANVTCNSEAVQYEAAAAAYEPDAAAADALAQIIADESIVLEQVVGESPEELDGVWENLRIDETNLGQAVTAAYLLETGADVAFENAGGIRANIPAGEVTYGDIIGVSPYGNYIVTEDLTGAQLREVLETNLEIRDQCAKAMQSGKSEDWPASSGSYLQMGGLTVTYDPTAAEGARVLDVTIAGAPLEEDKVYKVAMNNFLSTSKYHAPLNDAPVTGEYISCDQALMRYFSQGVQTIAADLAQPVLVSGQTADFAAATAEQAAEPVAATAEAPTTPETTEAVTPAEPKPAPTTLYITLSVLALAVLLGGGGLYLYQNKKH